MDKIGFSGLNSNLKNRKEKKISRKSGSSIHSLRKNEDIAVSDFSSLISGMEVDDVSLEEIRNTLIGSQSFHED